MPKAGRRSKPAQKSAEGQAEVAGQVNSSCGTQGNPSTGGQSTIKDKINLQTAGLKSNEECMQKKEFTSRNGKEEVDKEEETNVKKIIENLKMGSEEDKKTAALLEERHRQRVDGGSLNIGGAAAPPARQIRLPKPVFASTQAANMSAFIPPNLKKPVNTAPVTGNGSTAGTSSTAGATSGNKAQKKATASSSSCASGSK